MESPWPLRRAKAAATRVAIIQAASRLFPAHGYEGTSVQAVADSAGVSRATVFNSVGGKAQLLKAAYDVATVGDDLPIPLPQRPELMAVRDEPDQRRAISLYAAVIAGIGERLSAIYEVFRAASVSDPEIGDLWADIQQQRLQGARGFVTILSSKGRLRAGLDLAQAGDIVWALIDASLYHRLCHDRGWSRADFERWLAASLESQLL
ncbi:MAG: DNA-binding protein [Frankiales bacterium]|nr:DNA-binding protein [Frankiales bacterium]